MRLWFLPGPGVRMFFNSRLVLTVGPSLPSSLTATASEANCSGTHAPSTGVRGGKCKADCHLVIVIACNAPLCRVVPSVVHVLSYPEPPYMGWSSGRLPTQTPRPNPIILGELPTGVKPYQFWVYFPDTGMTSLRF